MTAPEAAPRATDSPATAGHGGARVVIVALAVNLLIAIGKFVAAGLSRSTAMLAEACHSLADSANQIFLLLGLRLSARPPDEKHPFGYGPETYFWAFIVALCIFAVGGAFSIYEGIHKILHAATDEHAMGSATSAYVVLGTSIALECYSLAVALREFRHLRGGRGVRTTLRETRDPTVLTVLFEDLAALFGLVVALGGVVLSHLTDNPVWDGAASVVVGLALVAVAFVLGRDAKGLLIGRGVPERERLRMEEIVRAAPDVVRVVHIRTIHLGPRDVMAGLKLTFNPSLDVHTLEQRINQLEAALRAALPQLTRIYVEPGFDEHTVRREAG
ncbi:MAG: cation transporter [Myxococcales bacterium]|nr:cation transporter [Myxococcales bacterium]